MEFKVKPYGSFEITEKIIIDLINSKAIQRLKKINQLGLPAKWHYGFQFSRYEHSLGVLYLSYFFNLDLNTKIAAILHDVAHTAFSHVIDYLIENYDEDYHDKNLKSYLEKDKEIITLLIKNNIVVDQFYDMDNNFSFIKRADRLLNLDRLDYTLREYYYMTNNSKKVSDIIDDLTIINNKFVFKNKKYAEELSKIFVDLSKNHWSGAKHKTAYLIFSKILKRALDTKLINLNDFYKTDDYILDILLKSDDPTIKENIQKLESGSFEIIPFKTKYRILDVLYLDKNKSIIQI